MVFLFILFVTILGIFSFIILFGKIVIEISNLKLTTKKQKHVNDNYKINFKLTLFGRFTIFKKSFNKQKIDNLKIKNKVNNKMKNINFNKIIKKEKVNTDVIKVFLKNMIEIVNIKLNIELGTKDAGTTAVLVGIVSTIISIIFRIKIKNIKDQYFKINPIYNSENIINMEISGIFALKLIHIINIIYILSKEKGEDKNVRSSNRKSYDYSYE